MKKNASNPKIHRETTGPEIWRDTDGKIDVFVSGVGTGGTVTGVSQYIKGCEKFGCKPLNPNLYTVAVEPMEQMLLTAARGGAKIGQQGPHKIQVCVCVCLCVSLCHYGHPLSPLFHPFLFVRRKKRKKKGGNFFFFSLLLLLLFDWCLLVCKTFPSQKSFITTQQQQQQQQRNHFRVWALVLFLQWLT
jgi:hypothetical protein